jgi:hypothetical protein
MKINHEGREGHEEFARAPYSEHLSHNCNLEDSVFPL